jgi:hypothetical protein
MAEFDYIEAANDALEIINDFGDKTAKLLEPASVLKDPLKPWLGYEDGFVEHKTTIALVPINNKDKSYLSETLASKTIKTAYVEDVILDIVPQLGWKIKHNNELWTIATIADLKPNTTNVYYDMIVMK